MGTKPFRRSAAFPEDGCGAHGAVPARGGLGVQKRGPWEVRWDPTSDPTEGFPRSPSALLSPFLVGRVPLLK